MEIEELERAAVELRKASSEANEMEVTKLRMEREEALRDATEKLRVSERESNSREDSLRREISDLRKRWQDAVRRADALSLDEAP